MTSEIKTTFLQWESVVSSFNNDNINTVPFKESWTPGQVAEHLIKANSGITKVLRGRVTDTKRDPEEKIPQTNHIFLDFSTKMKSPEQIVPTRTDHTTENLVSSIRQIKSDLLDVSEKEDLTKTCVDHQIPGMGDFTRGEWINFCLVHTQRHIHQLENIRRQMSVV